jgi:hypothetical protein
MDKATGRPLEAMVVIPVGMNCRDPKNNGLIPIRSKRPYWMDDKTWGLLAQSALIKMKESK